VHKPDRAFEAIVDDPTLANWKLVPHADDPHRVRIMTHRDSGQDLAALINERLAEFAEAKL
jgi:hypothetical protein